MTNTCYLDCELPKFLQESIDKNVPNINDPNCPLRDCHYCELQSDINVAEVEQLITSEQAWYLRGKYLGLEKGKGC